MASTIFDQLIAKGTMSGQLPARTTQAREWYRNTASKFTKINDLSFFKGDQSRLVNNPTIGSMYMFFYDPKTADKLPYYDIFPLVFPFKQALNGFYGLNMHYLPPQLRAKLMDGLYEYSNNSKYDETTKIKMNYSMLQRASNLKWFKPCVKRYLNSHVQSRFMYVKPEEWDICLFLPTERFVKQSKQNVWNESKRMLGR